MGKPKIFLSYVQEDKKKVQELYRKLSQAGFEPWMDKKDIFGGEEWLPTIQKAIRKSAIFLACLSPKSVDKRGTLQREIKQALDIWQEMLDGDIYLIPVRLKNYKAPEALRKFQWVNIYEKDGFIRLVQAICEGLKRKKMRLPKPCAALIDKSKSRRARKASSKTVYKANSKVKMKQKPPKKPSPRQRVSGKLSEKGKNPSQKASVSNSQMANPNIRLKEHEMLVEIKPDERVVTNKYLLYAFRKDVDLYRFKLRRTGSGRISVTTETSERTDYALASFGESAAEWEHYAVVFSQPLGKGKTKDIRFTYRLSDVNHDARPFHGFSYTDVAGCSKLSMSLRFSNLLIPDGIKLIRCDHNWIDIAPEEIYIKHRKIDERTREYSFEITPEQNVKYMVKWQPTANKTADEISTEAKPVAK